MPHLARAWRAGRNLTLVLCVAGACADTADEPVLPAGSSPALTPEDVTLEVAATCDDLGANRGWEDARCETGGNGACGGVGEATSDCAHCCEAPPPPSCADLAKQRGWAGFACEAIDDSACGGLGEASSDCDVCCEAPATPPTCAQVAAEWGYDQAVCEKDGDGSCGGEGIPSSDCDVCCDVGAGEEPDLADDPAGQVTPSAAELSDDDPSDADFAGDFPADDAPLPDEEEAEPSAPVEPSLDKTSPPPPPPPPSVACTQVAAANGWPNPKCEYDGNGACQGQGPATTDCDHCCSGTGAQPPATGCGNGVCEASETCSSCAKDCGACLRVAEVNLAGTDSKAKLHKLAKALRAQKPDVVGVQGATRGQVKFLSKQLKTGQSRFAAAGTQGGQKVGNAIMSRYRVRHFEAKRLPGQKAVLARGDVRTPLGEFPFGSTQLGGGAKAAASGAVSRLRGGHAMLAAGLGDTASSAAYRAIDRKLADGWKTSWGQGDTTAQREDFVFRGASWEAPVAGKVVGPRGGGQHGAVVQKFHLTRIDQVCDLPQSLGEAAEEAERPLGTSIANMLALNSPQELADFHLLTVNVSGAALFAPVDPGGAECPVLPLTGDHPPDNLDSIAAATQFSRAHGKAVRVHPVLWYTGTFYRSKEDMAKLNPKLTPEKLEAKWQAYVESEKGLMGWRDPSWLVCMGRKGQAKQAQEALEKYIADFGKLYQTGQGFGRDYSGYGAAWGKAPEQWVVLNEAIGPDGLPHRNVYDRLYRTLHKERYGYIVRAFQVARKANKTSKLLYNDNSCEFHHPSLVGKKASELDAVEQRLLRQNKKADGVYQLAKHMAHVGAPLDGVGFQMHLVADKATPAGKKRWDFYAEAFRANLRRYARIKHKSGKRGVDVYITELNIHGTGEGYAGDKLIQGKPVPPTPITDDERKNLFDRIIAVCSTEPNCKGVTVWGASDAEKWLITSFEGTGSTAGSQLYSSMLTPNPQTYCSAAQGFVAGTCDECSAWRPGPSLAVPCDVTVDCRR